jgi:hypothetical protein
VKGDSGLELGAPAGWSALIRLAEDVAVVTPQQRLGAASPGRQSREQCATLGGQYDVP